MLGESSDPDANITPGKGKRERMLDGQNQVTMPSKESLSQAG